MKVSDRREDGNSAGGRRAAWPAFIVAGTFLTALLLPASISSGQQVTGVQSSTAPHILHACASGIDGVDFVQTSQGSLDVNGTCSGAPRGCGSNGV